MAALASGATIAGVLAQAASGWFSARSAVRREDRLRFLEEKRQAYIELVKLFGIARDRNSAATLESASVVRLLAPKAVTDAVGVVVRANARDDEAYRAALQIFIEAARNDLGVN